jgi:hypothetical protein
MAIGGYLHAGGSAEGVPRQDSFSDVPSFYALSIRFIAYFPPRNCDPSYTYATKIVLADPGALMRREETQRMLYYTNVRYS